MPLVVEQSDFSSLYKNFAKDLHYVTYNNQNQFWEQLVADYYRWFICNAVEKGSSVHINRILAVGRTTLGPFIYKKGSKENKLFQNNGIDGDTDEGDIFNRTLYRLEIIRDIAHLGEGYYAPTPLRAVVTPTERILLIGGLPTKRVEEIIGNLVHVRGVIRTLDSNTYGDNLGTVKCPSQSFEGWSGISPESLDLWVKQCLINFEQDLEETNIDGSFEVYDPKNTNSSAQFFRWINSSQWDGNESSMWLCRTKKQPRRYWLGAIKRSRHGVICYKEAPISGIEVRKLQYGIDLIYRRPCSVLLKERENTFELKLSSFLPNAEMRLFYGLGHDISVRPDRLPMEFSFHKDVFEDICKMVKNLGITMRRE